LFRRRQILAYVLIRVGLVGSSRLALATFEQLAGIRGFDHPECRKSINLAKAWTGLNL